MGTSVTFVTSPGSKHVAPRRNALLSSGTCALRHQTITTRTTPETARIRMSTKQSSTSPFAPWPFKRFLRTFLWYTPLGPLVGRTSATLAVRQPTETKPAAAAAKPLRTGRTVLVTGAAGGVGRRVVRELLRDGVSVRALVRNRDGGVRALRGAGVSDELLDKAVEAAGPSSDAQLQFIVSDLYNLRTEMFDGVDAVISATGTRIGPSEDTPDRAMYFQGLTFYTPTVLEDTPENVEYVGVKALAEAAAAAFSKQDEAVEEDAGDVVTAPVWTFDSEEAVTATWGPLDDVVMGGVSASAIAVDKGELVFTGNLSVQNRGGFVSTRSINPPSAVDLSKYDGVLLRVRGDGKRYKFIVRCERKWDGLAHCCSFDTVDGEYVDVKLPWNGFNTVFRGRTVPTAAPLDPAKIFAAQIMLSKFEYDAELNPKFSDGPFELRLEAIKAYKESTNAERSMRKLRNRFIHCGSSGTTRVFRKDEFAEEDLPPAVQMNDKLGRIMDWKLAGEDAVRQALADYGYTIVRPCALTEKASAGLDKLVLAQGDNMRGQVSRDDVARLMVEALFDDKLTNRTIEVAQTDSEKTNAFATQAEKLVPDSDATSRTFGPFPYIPS